MNLLVARGICAAPPGATSAVVREISLELSAGEWLAIGGPNGGGKSTLAMVLAGLWPASAGTLEFDGVPLDHRSRVRVRDTIAVVFQDPSAQLLEATVADELLYTARNLGRAEEARAVLDRWIAAFELGPELGSDPRTLSAGRQQIVLLGAALAARPRLLIADEPAAHLDAEARSVLLEWIRDEVNRGLAVVWVTQQEAERAAADRSIDIGGTPANRERADVAIETAGAPLLTLAVSAWRGGRGPALRTSESFELVLHERGVTALTGPNGCGKSVLLQVAVGLIETEQCRVIWNSPPAAPPILASQYPDQQIFEEKVEDELIYAAIARGMPRTDALEAAREALRRLSLPPEEFMQKRCWWLSGGEKRLVGSIAALIAPAGLVALDEPTAGLDPERGRALQLIVIERSSRNPVLIASQDLAWAERLHPIRLGKFSRVDSTLPSTSKKTD